MAEKPEAAEDVADDGTEVDSAVGTLVSTLLGSADETGNRVPDIEERQEVEQTAQSDSKEKAENDARETEKSAEEAGGITMTNAEPFSIE